MVEVFITNVKKPFQAKKMLQVLENNFSELEINFDLEDSEGPFPCNYSILRVEGGVINSENIISTMNRSGFECAVLEGKICS